jgi:coat protein Gp5
MANTLGIYSPIFYAQEALIQLEKALGMAGRVHRGYSKQPQEKGKVISIRRPSTFTAQNAPSSAQDLNTGNVDITLDQWKEVKFKLTDAELSWTQEQIITEHIRPAAYALADSVDQVLAQRYREIPWFVDGADPAPVSDLTKTWQVLFDNQVPMSDESAVSLMLNGERTADFLALEAFSNAQWNNQNETAQRRGSLGVRYGMEIFSNQNVQTHTPGTVVTGADQAGAVVGAHAAGSATLAVGSFAATETFKAGDSFVITGFTQRYAVTADVTLSGGAATLAISPPLKDALAGSEVVTVRVQGASNRKENLAFHRNAFALATAPLSEMGNELGAKIATLVSPDGTITLRSRVFYMPDVSEVRVALDILYGVKTLDANLAVRYNSI